MLVAEFAAVHFHSREDRVADPEKHRGCEWAVGQLGFRAKLKRQAKEKGGLWAPPAALCGSHQEIRFGAPNAMLFLLVKKVREHSLERVGVGGLFFNWGVEISEWSSSMMSGIERPSGGVLAAAVAMALSEEVNSGQLCKTCAIDETSSSMPSSCSADVVKVLTSPAT